MVKRLAQQVSYCASGDRRRLRKLALAQRGKFQDDLPSGCIHFGRLRINKHKR